MPTSIDGFLAALRPSPPRAPNSSRTQRNLSYAPVRPAGSHLRQVDLRGTAVSSPFEQLRGRNRTHDELAGSYVPSRPGRSALPGQLRAPTRVPAALRAATRPTRCAATRRRAATWFAPGAARASQARSCQRLPPSHSLERVAAREVVETKASEARSCSRCPASHAFEHVAARVTLRRDAFRARSCRAARRRRPRELASRTHPNHRGAEPTVRRPGGDCVATRFA